MILHLLLSTLTLANIFNEIVEFPYTIPPKIFLPIKIRVLYPIPTPTIMISPKRLTGATKMEYLTSQKTSTNIFQITVALVGHMVQ